MSNRVSVHIDATSTVEFHCEHKPYDQISLKIEHPDDRGVAAYLAGTPDELVAFAGAIVAAVEGWRGQADVADVADLADLLAEAERRRDERNRFEAVQ